MDDPGPSSQYYASFPSTSSGPIRPPSPPSSPPLSATEPLNPEDGLYTILNLERSASEAEIRDRYRSLASTFHPDRQRTSAHQHTAHKNFTEIQRAYEVLTDSTKRTIYDLFGEEGLKTTWEIGPKIKSTEEMRQHFQRQYFDKKAMAIESLVKPKSDISLVLDARAVTAEAKLFKNPESMRFDIKSRMERMRPGQIMMKHSWEVPAYKDKTQVVVTGQMVSRSGAGGGNVVGTIRHQFSPRCWGELGTSVLSPRVLTGKGTYTFDENTYVTVNTMQQTFAAPPTFTAQLGRRIYPFTTGFIVFKSGYWTLGPYGKNLPPNPITQALSRETSALSVGLTTSRPNGTGWTASTQAGLSSNNLSADYSWRYIGLKWKVGGAVGTDGVNGFVDGESKVGMGRMGCTVNLAMGGGVTMRLRYSRLGQRIAIPILLSQNLNPYVLLGSTVLSFSIYAAVYHFILVPRKKRRIAERITDLRSEHSDHLFQKRSEALEAQDLMSRSIAQKVQSEREKNGLIIISAQYGLAEAFTDRGVRSSRSTPISKENGQNGYHGVEKVVEEEEEVIIDVTGPIQSLVGDSSLYIPGGRPKHNLLGFWDPCIGENKKLRVRYLFRDKLHEVTISDTVGLRIPLKSHSLDQE